MRILGLDYGAKRIGVAISDPLGITAQPVAVIEKTAGFEQNIQSLTKIIDQYGGVEEIVVGLPKRLSGKIGIAAEKVLVFVEALKKTLPLKIVTWDERLTTVQAEKNLIAAGLSRTKRKKVIDRSAATFILRSYLDRKIK
ncbi:Holliday junction DNA helicase RuvA [candidate division WOR-1 bacterium RIFCSPLOWO2_02_FULL_46_20]|uniref:Putative pre-16S rRNA nuclease n=2 Tax=Saganbacteria TaxID=1703751 RepID=A0A1F4R3R3_UNCSA|nr:MAG: Holliday junction DNA helicase RuvA [candidate division WOR-1 bacterium RIFCSPHIGHO2_02_FULL_45_12]OGC02885.1 MAG: Holliday junction DNA helicase RuvA [candidate division WOR-1 bacterium RIFCSPLOWO2_02_FULL_46_20]OGC08276.1 MAG: Holliday junction DNA helicase RuvA [candidate division WOR-1 bacterium RIFCSPLOWO2_12_FULL_45_9]